MQSFLVEILILSVTPFALCVIYINSNHLDHLWLIDLQFFSGVVCIFPLKLTLLQFGEFSFTLKD